MILCCFLLLHLFQDGFNVFPDDGSTSPQDVPIYLDINVPGVYMFSTKI